MVQNDVAEAVYVQRVSRLHVGQHALVRVKPVERRVHIADVVDACDSGLWMDSWHWVAVERRREHVQPLLAACTVGDEVTVKRDWSASGPASERATTVGTGRRVGLGDQATTGQSGTWLTDLGQHLVDPVVVESRDVTPIAHPHDAAHPG